MGLSSFWKGGATGFFLGMAALASITGVVARGAWFERIPVDSSAENFEKKYAVVTGGTQGIGAELVAQLKEQGYEVMDAGRSANGHYLDLGEAASIKACCNRIKSVLHGNPLDLLVLNAGVWNGSHTLTYDRVESTFQTNHFGHAYMTEMLMDCLKMSEHPRVVVVSSLAAYGGIAQDSVEDWQQQLYSEPPWFNYLANFYRYCDSKLCNILFAQELKARNPWLTVATCHPGSTFTKIWAGQVDHFILEFVMRLLFKSPKGASQTPLFCCLADDVRSDVLYSELSPMPLPIQATKAARELLWEASQREIRKMADRAKIQVGDFKK